MKLREIKRRVDSEMNVNVNMRRCRRAKKIVKDKLAGNFVKEFATLWDYTDELRLKNSESTINITVNRVTPESPPHFKRFYVCFEALKRSGKEGSRPILGLDGCLLKGLFKGEILSTFLSLLIADLGMEYGFWYTIISDQQKDPLSLCLLRHLEQKPDDYLHRYHHKETYLKAYAYVLQPIDGSHEWRKSYIEPVLPLVEKTIPGRQKKNRRKTKNEQKKVRHRQLSRVRLIMRCRKCGGKGHNRRSCNQPNTIGL
ncbi:hypothetical protein Golob_021476 [Gossypium lobatum]|uniref:CCHC-type domain-containing protein n=1 Tax=Gossypium lobatum TaxID=34289 RepID=A0A7J8LDM6_9ROSI|nr:hypothetical protein [Gossypium lobatum]